MPAAAMVLLVPASVSPLDAINGMPPSLGRLLNRRPNRLCQREIGRENRDRHALLPLSEDHRHVDAAALLVELDRAREALRGGAGGQVHRPDRPGDLDLVGCATGFQRFDEYRRMAVAAK